MGLSKPAIIAICSLTGAGLVGGGVLLNNQIQKSEEPTTTEYVEQVKTTESTTVPAPKFTATGIKAEADDIQFYPCKLGTFVEDRTEDYEFSVIEKDGKFGLIDFDGEIILPVENERIFEISLAYGGNHLYIQNDDGTTYAVSKDGSLLEDYGYPGGDVRPDPCWYNGEWVLFDITGFYEDEYGKELYDSYKTADEISLYNYTRTAVKWDTDAVIPVREIVSATDMGMGYSAEYSEKWGFLDIKNNKMVSDFVYDYVDFEHGFMDGLLAVKKDGKWGYINEKGETVIDFIYDNCTEKEGGWGEEVGGYSAQNGYILVQKDGKFGILDTSGNVIVDIIYDDASQVNKDGFLWLLQNGIWELYKINK